MRSSARVYESKDGATVERYVTAAIIGAREGYRDPKWLFWADNWLSGRDRSYESARLAHDRARSAYLGAANRNDVEPIETMSDESPAERAAWAAGLALLTAPMGPSLNGTFLRFEAAVKRNVARLLATLPAWFPAAGSGAGLARRLGAPWTSSQVQATEAARL